MILQGESLVRSSKSWFFPRRYGEIICCSQSCLFFLLKAKIITDGLAFDNLYYWPYVTGHCGSWSIPFVMCKTMEEINQQWPKTCHYHQSKKLWISNATNILCSFFYRNQKFKQAIFTKEMECNAM